MENERREQTSGKLQDVDSILSTFDCCFFLELWFMVEFAVGCGITSCCCMWRGCTIGVNNNLTKQII